MILIASGRELGMKIPPLPPYFFMAHLNKIPAINTDISDVLIYHPIRTNISAKKHVISIYIKTLLPTIRNIFMLFFVIHLLNSFWKNLTNGCLQRILFSSPNYYI